MLLNVCVFNKLALEREWNDTCRHHFADEGLRCFGEDGIALHVRDERRGGEEEVFHRLGVPFEEGLRSGGERQRRQIKHYQAP